MSSQCIHYNIVPGSIQKNYNKRRGTGKRHRKLGCLHERHRSLSLPLSVLFKWASTSTKTAAQCRCKPTLHAALFFQVAQARWPIRALIAFTFKRFPFSVYRPRMKLIEQQVLICVIICCRIPDPDENRAHRIAGLPLDQRKLTWWPFWAIAAHVNST